MIKVTKEHLDTPAVSYCLSAVPQFIFHNGTTKYSAHFVECYAGTVGSVESEDQRTLSEFLKERD